MIVGEFIDGYSLESNAYQIRKSVFLEEMECDPIFLEDELDKKAYHLVIHIGKEPVGTGRIILGQEESYIGRIAVLKAYRGQSIGDLIVKMLIDKAFRLGIDEVFVYAQVGVLAFYQGIGFKVVSGPFIKEGVEVIKMVITEKMVVRLCEH